MTFNHISAKEIRAQVNASNDFNFVKSAAAYAQEKSKYLQEKHPARAKLWTRATKEINARLGELASGVAPKEPVFATFTEAPKVKRARKATPSKDARRVDELESRFAKLEALILAKLA